MKRPQELLLLKSLVARLCDIECVLGVTWDEEEGALLWFRDTQGSTRVRRWSELEASEGT